MDIFGYLRASTDEQDANRAKNELELFVQQNGYKMRYCFTENVSGASLKRPELFKLLDFAQEGDCLLVEAVDRLSRLSEDDWVKLKRIIDSKSIKIISLDLPTSHMILKPIFPDEFMNSVFKAFNNMMLDTLAAVARKDYVDRRRRAAQGIKKAKEAGKYKGRQFDKDLYETIYKLRVENDNSIAKTAKLTRVHASTVCRAINKINDLKERGECWF
ncbi:Putative transposon Tn552 DNA-invertase bin3 [Allocatenococcus thiocycli]|nr:Putative transposon Tn552 DNA-invertase bin3 [Catenococcus thiocycli]